MTHRRITPQQANALVGMLVVTGSGWTDASVDATVELVVRKWAHYDIAAEAIQRTVDTWTNQGRPPWGVLHQAYRTAAHRQALNTSEPSAIGSGSVVAFSEGRRIAARSYATERRRQGAEPSPSVLDAFLGTIGEQT